MEVNSNKADTGKSREDILTILKEKAVLENLDLEHAAIVQQVPENVLAGSRLENRAFKEAGIIHNERELGL